MPTDAAQLVADHSINPAWAGSAIDKAFGDLGTAIGLLSGNRAANDTRTINLLARQLVGEVTRRSLDRRILLVRLDVYESAELDRLIDQSAGLPAATRSPLGPWSEVSVPMPVGDAASWSLLQIPIWMATWRQSYDLLLLDVGPINQVPARVVSRMCQSNYLVLGPEPSGSHAWINRHCAWLAQSGVEISGSLLATSPIAHRAA